MLLRIVKARRLLAVSLSFLGALDASAATTTYTHDRTGRLTTAIYDNGLCLAYSYDPVGNRTSIASVTSSSAVWGAGVWGCFSWIP